jgi:hypothetical protein
VALPAAFTSNSQAPSRVTLAVRRLVSLSVLNPLILIPSGAHKIKHGITLIFWLPSLRKYEKHDEELVGVWNS